MVSEEFLQKALDTGAASVGVRAVDGVRPHLVRPEGYELVAVPESLLVGPSRLDQIVYVYDPKSFTDYFTDYCNPSSRIFVDRDVKAPKILAVLDYHHDEPIAPDWCKHRLFYAFRNTPEWTAWTGKNRQTMKQIEFARFIEENLPDIVHPAHADMLQISRRMEAKKNVSFSSGVRLQNGEIQLTYTEEIRGTAGQDTLEVPELFKIKIAPFEGSEPTTIDCRFRYSIKESALELRYEMVRPQKVIEAAVARVIEQIKAGVNNPITFGTV